MKRGLVIVLAIAISIAFVSVAFSEAPKAANESFPAAKQPMSKLDILLVKQDIVDALAAYSFAWDGDPLKPEGNPEAWADIFVEDGVFQAIGTDGVVMDRWVSRAERIDCAKKLGVGSKKMADPLKMKHLMQQFMWDEITPTTAKTRTSVIIPVVNNAAGAVTAMPMGVYYDIWVKTETGWKISSRTFRFDITVPMPHGTGCRVSPVKGQ